MGRFLPRQVPVRVLWSFIAACLALGLIAAGARLTTAWRPDGADRQATPTSRREARLIDAPTAATSRAQGRTSDTGRARDGGDADAREADGRSVPPGARPPRAPDPDDPVATPDPVTALVFSVVETIEDATEEAGVIQPGIIVELPLGGTTVSAPITAPPLPDPTTDDLLGTGSESGGLLIP